MARRHARVLVTIWDDPDWTALDPTQQVTYVALLSSADLSWCGVNPLLPQRLVPLSRGLTERKVRTALQVLTQRRFLVTDYSTAEVAVRTFVRHDGVLAQPNVAKAMCRAVSQVRSDVIRDSVLTELARELIDDPDARGWHAIKSSYPALFTEITTKALGNP